MNTTISSPTLPASVLVERVAAIRTQISAAFIGQADVLDQLLIALLAGGHVLIEGVPGLGKTLLVRALAASMQGSFSRVQFTPDLMPSDVSGHAFYDPKTESFKIRRGPVFANLLLADEINRAPAKTQSALLEAMQESQVTIESRSFPLEPPFLTIATQNPVEQEGTYPLPEAQLDRFLLKILIDYPALEDELRMVQSVSAGRATQFDLARVRAVVQPADIVAMQEIDFTIGQGSWLARQVNIRLSGDARRPYRIVQARLSGLRNLSKGIGIMTRLPIRQ